MNLNCFEMEEDRIKSAIDFIRLNLGRTEFADSVFISFLCGYFHTYPKKAREVADIILNLGLMRRERRQSIMYWITNPRREETATGIAIDAWGWNVIPPPPRRKRRRKKRSI